MTILHERVAAARDAASRRAAAIEHLARTDRAGVDARRALAEAERTRDELASELPPGLDLGIVLARWAERDGLAAAIADQRTQLVLQSDGLDEVSLRAALAAFDADTAEARLQGLAQEDDGLDHAAQETFAEQDRALRRRAELEQGVGAEVAAQQRRNAEAELVETAREWAVRKIGALMIGAAVERHRASQEDPLLARAEGLFAMLTGGAYDGVVQEFDDGDTPRLVGRRPDGRTIPIQGMSEGARDQALPGAAPGLSRRLCRPGGAGAVRRRRHLRQFRRGADGARPEGIGGDRRQGADGGVHAPPARGGCGRPGARGRGGRDLARLIAGPEPGPDRLRPLSAVHEEGEVEGGDVEEAGHRGMSAFGIAQADAFDHLAVKRQRVGRGACLPRRDAERIGKGGADRRPHLLEDQIVAGPEEAAMEIDIGLVEGDEVVGRPFHALIGGFQLRDIPGRGAERGKRGRGGLDHAAGLEQAADGPGWAGRPSTIPAFPGRAGSNPRSRAPPCPPGAACGRDPWRRGRGSPRAARSG